MAIAWAAEDRRRRINNPSPALFSPWAGLAGACCPGVSAVAGGTARHPGGRKPRDYRGRRFSSRRAELEILEW